MPDQLDLDGLQRALWGFAGQRVITVAGRTGILHALAGNAVKPDALADKLDLDPLATGKIVRALCAQGVVIPDGDGYRLAEPLRPFFAGDADDFGPFLEHLHTMYEKWGETLEPWLRGESWPVSENTPEHTRRFGAAMRAMGAQIARRVAHALDLDGVRTMLDVGGGWGHFSRALRERNPEIHATVLDIPGVAEAAPASLAGTEHEGMIDWIGGDYLETDPGSDFDLVLIANVLHQELAPRAAELVRRAAGALAPGGRVVVVDFVIDDAKREHPFGTLFAINMRSFGDTWSEPEIRGWMTDVGLVDIRCTDIGPDRWLITGRKNDEL